MVWPKALINELVARRCIIFLGSGASAGSISQDQLKRPPTWGNFLSKLISLMRDRKDEKVINEYLQKEKFLEAAEIIHKNIPPADYSSFIREELENPRYQPSAIHRAVLEIDPKIVITTNYDTIYDKYCTQGSAADGYVVSKYYDSNIVPILRSPVRLVLKAHGCVTDVDRIVLTKSQYFNARQKQPNFYKALDALFLTHTILFIGYSLTDPDIQLVLENVNISAASSHPHYFVTGNDLNSAIKDANTKAYNIEFIEFPAGDWEQLNNGLLELSEFVRAARIANPGQA